MKKEIKKFEKNEFDQIITTSKMGNLLCTIVRAEEDMYIALDACVRVGICLRGENKMFDLMHNGFSEVCSNLFDIEFDSMSTINERKYERRQALIELFKTRYEKIEKAMVKLNKMFGSQKNLISELNSLTKNYKQAISSFVAYNK